MIILFPVLLALSWAALVLSASVLTPSKEKVLPPHPLSPRLLPSLPLLPTRLLAPTKDDFYQIPKNLSSYEAGEIIRWRSMPSLVPLLGTSSASKAYQIFYRTNSVRDLSKGKQQPDATVTTVIAPLKPADGPPKIVAIATPEDSACLDCSPSYILYTASMSGDTTEAGIMFLEAAAALFNGYYVTIPDLEGSKAAWLTYSEGQAMLDGIRATVNHPEVIADKRGYRVALTGYSGGGHGSTWAAQLASTYGKGVPIAALAAGGVPVDLEACFNFLDGTSQSSLVFEGVAGLSNAYPQLEAFYQGILKPNGTKAMEDVRTGAYCPSKAATAFANKSFKGSTTMKDPNKAPIPQRIFAENFLGRSQKPITDFPIMLTHSTQDNTVPFGPAATYYRSQCSQGAKIRFIALPSGGHQHTGVESIVPFFDFIKQAFDGQLRLENCSRVDEFAISLNSSRALAVAGPQLVQQISAVLPLVANV